MVNKNYKLQLYTDAMIIQAAFGDKIFIKSAASGLVAELMSSVKNYVSGKIDQNDKVGSVIDLIAPSAMIAMFGSLNLKIISFLFALAMRVFNIDTSSILSNISSGVKGLISGDKLADPASVDNIVNSAFSSVPKGSEQEAKSFLKINTSSNNFNMELRKAQLLKIALIKYNDDVLTKNAGITDFITKFIVGKGTVVTFLSKAIGWAIKTILISAGLMVGADAISKLIDNKPKDNKENNNAFKVSPSYSNRVLNSSSSMWVENGSPTESNIKNMLLNWTKEVYPETKDFVNQILSSAAFQVVVEAIEDYNISSKSGNMIFIPKMYTTKKSAVDIFIDDVANKVKQSVA